MIAGLKVQSSVAPTRVALMRYIDIVDVEILETAKFDSKKSSSIIKQNARNATKDRPLVC